MTRGLAVSMYMLYIEYRYEQKMSAQTLERQMLDQKLIGLSLPCGRLPNLLMLVQVVPMCSGTRLPATTEYSR